MGAAIFLTFLSKYLSSLIGFEAYSSGSTQRMRVLVVSEIGLPAWSLAGVKRARRLRMLQVVLSSDDEPDDDVTVQSVTRPSMPIVNRTAVVPCSSFRMDD